MIKHLITDNSWWKPWDQITNHIQSKYQILETISLDVCGNNMIGVYYQLLPYKSKEFSPTEKIILYLFDTQFYLDKTGFTIYNLQLILKDLDISQSAIILLTNQYGVESQVHTLGKTLCNDDWKMQVFTSNYVYPLTSKTPCINESLSEELICYPYISLNGEQRTHRVMFLSMLSEYNLLDKGIVTWNFNFKKQPLYLENNNDSGNILSHNNSLNFQFLTTNPFSAFNDNIQWHSNLQSIYSAQSEKFTNKTGFTVDINDPPLHTLTPLEFFKHRLFGNRVKDYFQKSFLTVITETTFSYPAIFITEKTFQSIVNRRPFVLLAESGTLKTFRQLGFKTFDSIIDESYDEICDPSERINKVIDIVKTISALSIEDLQQLIKVVEPILEYNYQYYHNVFGQADLEKALQNL